MILFFIMQLSLLYTQHYEIDCANSKLSIATKLDISEDTLFIDMIITNKLKDDILIPIDFEQSIQDDNKIHVRYKDVVKGEIPPPNINLNYIYVPSNGVYRLVRPIKIESEDGLEILRIDFDFHKYEEFIANKERRFYREKVLKKGIITFLVTKRLLKYYYSKISGIDTCSIVFYFKDNKIEDCNLY